MTKEYPISEIFTSPQGEGVYTGQMTTFIRLAGCTVGKPFPREQYHIPEGRPGYLPIYTEKCTTWDGREFPCDTDYRTKFRLPASDIAKRVQVRNVCITGGEPLMHDLDELMFCLRTFSVHIETSGTVAIESSISNSGLRAMPWVTVSPKKGLLPNMVKRADEIKILVDEHFKWDDLPEDVQNHDNLFLQPINFEHTIRSENVRLVMDLQKAHPNVRISLQLHKVLEMITQERVL